MKATPTLQGCFGKLARAEKLINELRRQNLDFFTKGDFKSEIVRNPETGRQQLVATKVQAPPVSHSLIVGDILYNLRSCLDHLVHQLIVANTGAQPTYRTYEFPVFVTENQFNKNVDRLLRDVSPDGVERIKQVQPFTFERPKDTSLYNLNEMGLVDKHRLPLLAVIRGRVSAMTAEDENAEMMWFGGGYDDLVEAGSVLATFDARVPDCMKLNAIVPFDMALADGPHDRPAVRMMEMMWRVVRQILEHVGVSVDALGRGSGPTADSGRRLRRFQVAAEAGQFAAQPRDFLRPHLSQPKVGVPLAQTGEDRENEKRRSLYDAG